MGRSGPDGAPVGGGRAVLISQRIFCRLHFYPGPRAYIDRSAPYSHLTFFVVQLLSVVLAPIPSNLTGGGGRSALRHLARLFPHLWGGDGWLSAGVLAGPDPGAGLCGPVVSRKLAEKYQKVIREKTTVFLALAFLLPYFPDDMLCILQG